MYVGEPILAVAAVSEQAAEDAIEKIKIDYEPLPFTHDPLESLFPGGKDARGDGFNIGTRAGLPPGKLKWAAADFARVDEAFAFEKMVQGWNRKKRIALIEGRWDDLPALASRAWRHRNAT